MEIISPDVQAVRPTVDHFKKHILRIYEESPRGIVWDLFSGAGGVGLELVSAGARAAVFVEQMNKPISCLKLNLSQMQLKDPQTFSGHDIKVIQGTVELFLKNPKNFGVTEVPHFVFLDPPYGQNWMAKVIPLLLRCPVCGPQTLFVAEHVADDTLPSTLKIHKQEVYGPKIISCFRFVDQG